VRSHTPAKAGKKPPAARIPLSHGRNKVCETDKRQRARFAYPALECTAFIRTYHITSVDIFNKYLLFS
jgi:hypothetical protein